MALKDNFKDALDDIVGMFDNPKAQGLITALSSAAKPPQGGRVAENLSVPFGATFEQGAALRGEAQQQDAQGDARAAAERQAQIEAQRVALEGRRVAEGERAGEHARVMNDMSAFEQIQAQQDFEVVKQEDQQQHDIAMSDQNYVQSTDLEYLRAKNDLENAGIMAEREQNSPKYMADIAQSESMIGYYDAMTLRQVEETAQLKAAAVLGDAKTIAKGLTKNGRPTAESMLAWQDGLKSVFEGMTNMFQVSSDPVELERRTTIDWMAQGYEVGAVDVSVFQRLLPPKEYSEMLELDAIYKEAMSTGDLTKYMQARNRILNDLRDDYIVNDSASGLIPGTNMPLPPAQPSPIGARSPIAAPSPSAVTTTDASGVTTEPGGGTRTVPYLPPGSKPGATPGRRPINYTEAAYQAEFDRKREQALTAPEKKAIKEGLGADFRGYSPR